MNKRKFVICLGATGGHIFPGIAIADAIKQSLPDSEILFINTLKSNKMLPKLNFNYEISGINIYGFVGKSILKKVKSFLSLFICIIKTLLILIKFKPEAVIGSGGFVWLPVGISSFILNKKIYTIEGNSIPGLSNKIISKLSNKIFINFESSLNHFNKSKCFNLGYPIRQVEKKREAKKDIDILIIGGSQGSETLNTKFLAQLENLLNQITRQGINEFTIIHQTGIKDFQKIKEIASKYESKFDFLKYSVEIFINEISDYYSRTKLLISRAGASTLSETKNFDLVNIVVPIKNSTNNHQNENAIEMYENGLAEIWQEDDQTLILTNKILNLLWNKVEAAKILNRKRNEGNNYSAENIVKEILRDEQK